MFHFRPSSKRSSIIAIRKLQRHGDRKSLASARIIRLSGPNFHTKVPDFKKERRDRPHRGERKQNRAPNSVTRDMKAGIDFNSTSNMNRIR